MTSVDLAGEASFSTFNIRRCGQMAPKVESGAFQLFGRECRTSGWPQWGGGPTGGAREPERGALEREGSGGRKGAVPTAAQQARACHRRGRCDGGSGGRSGRSVVGPGRPFALGCAGHRRTDDPVVGLGELVGFGQFVGRHDSRPAGAGPFPPGPVGAGPVAPGPIPPGPVVSPCCAGGSDCRRPGWELLVYCAVGRGSNARACAKRRRDHSLLALIDCREPVASDTSWQSEPDLRRPDSSSSSHLDRDVPSAVLRLADS